MKPEVLAQARRYYHHVLHGGTLRPEDVSFMVEALEEAAHQREWAGLTKEEMLELFEKYNDRPFSLILVTSDKLKEKNT